MILMNKMKISIIGSSQDTIFFIERSKFLGKNILFSVFDSKEIQDNLNKSYDSVETPWNISDVLKDSSLILNGCSIKNSMEFFEIIKNNNSNLPIIDLSLFKSRSIQNYNENNISNIVLHSMPVGKLNIDPQRESVRIPVILNNKLNTIRDDNLESFFKLLKLNLRFIDIDEHDSLIVSNYVLTNLYLLYLLDNMKNKSSILSNNFNQNYINKFSNIIDSEILDNLDDYVFSKITSDSNFKMFIEKIKKNDFKLSIDEIRSFSDQSLLSIPKSKDTLLSLFFGEKFSKTISNWGKERK